MSEKYIHIIIVLLAILLFLTLATYDQVWNPLAKYGYTECQWASMKGEHNLACHAVGKINPLPSFLSALSYLLSLLFFCSSIFLIIKKSKKKPLKIYLFAYSFLYASIPFFVSILLNGV